MHPTNKLLTLLVIASSLTCHCLSELLLANDSKESALSHHSLEEAKQEVINQLFEANRPLDKKEVLGTFEPTDAYFSKKNHQGDKRGVNRPSMRCVRFNWATRRCSRYALVGIWA